ncbi:MAG: hypothetical protein FJX59_10005 [Alphaproteobacteria bacterium]|nr:hypothetical protein [Alphaproteobacteria bacterium]
MKNTVTGIIVAAVALFGMGAAFATEAPTMTRTEIQAELKKIQKAAGAGEMSSKTYNVRKKELTAALAAQQIGEAKK